MGEKRNRGGPPKDLAAKDTGAKDTATQKPPIIIKKYANRRLYNTERSGYVTLDHLAELVKKGVDFVVQDAKTGEDITRQILTHIIVEEENKGVNLLPIGFLRHLISFYGDSLQAVVPNYLEQTMQAFARNQEQMRGYVQGAFRGFDPFDRLEEAGKRNMAIFENAMKMFAPLAGADGAEPKSPPAAGEKTSAAPPDDEKTPAADGQLRELQKKVTAMQRQLDALTKEKR